MYTLIRTVNGIPSVVGNYETKDEAHCSMENDVKFYNTHDSNLFGVLKTYAHMKYGNANLEWWICLPENERLK